MARHLNPAIGHHMPAIWNKKGPNASADMMWVVRTTMLGTQDDEEKNDICNKSEMKHVE